MMTIKSLIKTDPLEIKRRTPTQKTDVLLGREPNLDQKKDIDPNTLDQTPVHPTPAVIENIAEIREIINQDQDRHLADLLLGHGQNVRAVGRSRDLLIRDQDLEIVAVIQKRRLEIIRPREDAHQEAPVLQPLVVLIRLGLDQDHHVGIEKDMGQGDVDDCIG